MIKRIDLWLAFAVIGVSGSLMHFCYKLSGDNPIVGIFCAVNESTWEHLKLLFFPSALYFAAADLLSPRRLSGAVPSAAGIFSGITAITVLFYTYSGVLGRSIALVNILLFFVGVFVALSVREAVRINIKSTAAAQAVAGALIILTAVLFGIFTFFPPALGIFVSPDGILGIK